MLKNKLSLSSLVMLAAWGSLHAAEPAGRVLVLQGGAVAVRGAQEVPLARGANIESGDLLRVGDGSSLQVRFTDESVVALRANTQFKIEDYKFTEKGEGDKSIFGLLKGGMRTITGLIGKRNPDAYEMRGATATIGIRGTGYTAVNCAGDCFNPDGSKVEDGLYGGVSIGRIVVRNQAGEMEFVRDQYFTVGSSNSLPSQLLIPPGFLRDKLDGMAKAGKSTPGKTAEPVPVATAGATVTASTPPATTAASTPTAPTTTTLATASTYVPAATPNTVVSTGSTLGSGTALNFSFVGAYAEKWQWSDSTGTNSGVWGDSYGAQVTFDPTLGGDYDYLSAASSAGYTSMADFFKLAYTHSYTFTDSYTGEVLNGTINKSASTDIGSSAAAGNVTWGRFTETSTETGSLGGQYSWTGIQHWAVGDPVTAPPTSGIFTYAAVGGTSPTDSNGTVGTMLNRGEWTVNFGTNNIQTTKPIAWSMPNGATYSVSVPSQTFQVTTYSGANVLKANMTGTGLTEKVITTTAGGSLATQTSFTGVSSASSTIGVVPFGAQAQGMGAGVSTYVTLPNGTQQTIGSVQVYKR